MLSTSLIDRLREIVGPANLSTGTLRIGNNGTGSFGVSNGGRLTVKGAFDDTPQGRGALDGTLKIRDFRVIRAPIIAQILNVMALTGILDVLRGGGIRFAALDAPQYDHGS